MQLKKRLKLIYNPNAGNKNFKNELDNVVSVFQGAGYETHLFRTMEKGDIKAHLAQMDHYDTVVVSGGDGTINIVLNGLLKNGHSIPLGIIPSGTANDFATFLKLPKEPAEAAKMIAYGQPKWVDVGLANSQYFINVCSAGLLTNISRLVDDQFKNTVGKLAYYLKGIEQIPNFVPIPARITNTSRVFHEDIFLFLALNSAGTGGFERLATHAQIDDGLLDFIAFKACPLVDLAMLFLKVLSGDFLNEPNILHFQDEYIKIEFLNQNESHTTTDIDGEAGEPLPLEIRSIYHGAQIFCNL